MQTRPRSGALGTFVVALGVVGMSWLGLRAMRRAQERVTPTVAATTAAPTRDPSTPLVPTIPSEMIADAGKVPIARVDLVLRVDGVVVSLEGAPVCRDGARSTVGRAADGAPGSFDASALRVCLAQIAPDLQGKTPIATITRVGPAIATDRLDALADEVRRARIERVVVQP